MLATILCAFCAWTIIILSATTVWFTVIKGTTHLRRLHQIPCAGCEFFTNDYRLKCTVHPIKACSEEAIGCIDFQPISNTCNACQRGQCKLY
jgi:hypothetical protein